MPETRLRVFISYSHDSPQHEHRVLALADRLRGDNIDAIIDQYEPNPSQGWSAWCEDQFREADFVLVVCTEAYVQKYRRQETERKASGVLWEADLIRNYRYESGEVNKLVALLFRDGNTDYIPDAVKSASRFWIDTPEDYDSLCRLLKNQPRVRKPEMGRWGHHPTRQPADEPAKVAGSAFACVFKDITLGRPLAASEVQSIDLTGQWQGTDGLTYYIWQDGGDHVRFRGFHPQGGWYSLGEGQILGRDMFVSYRTAQGATGRGELAISPGGQQLSGQVADNTGASLTITLVR